jgi:hypothetical protein
LAAHYFQLQSNRLIFDFTRKSRRTNAAHTICLPKAHIDAAMTNQPDFNRLKDHPFGFYSQNIFLANILLVPVRTLEKYAFNVHFERRPNATIYSFGLDGVRQRKSPDYGAT